MRVLNGRADEVLVGRDSAGSFVELQFVDGIEEKSRVVRLTNDEARRLAALILFQAARLKRAPRWAQRPA